MCGACTVHVDGKAGALVQHGGRHRLPSGRRITTIENVARHAVGEVRCSAPGEELDVVQCGYCQSGQIMSAAALLDEKPKPTDADIDATMPASCRCATYVRIRAAISLHAARGLKRAMALAIEEFQAPHAARWRPAARSRRPRRPPSAALFRRRSRGPAAERQRPGAASPRPPRRPRTRSCGSAPTTPSP